MTYRKKLIEVALPLDAINEASVRESYIYKGNPSSMHKWWAQRPLAASRAVIFASLVNDPSDPASPLEFIEVCKKLPRGKNAAENDTPRQRLFDFIETLIQWESTTDEQLLNKARELIRLATDNTPPSLLDPFAGGGTIPIEAQRLGLETYASDLNPVAIVLNKALIEIPNKFANLSPVNLQARSRIGQNSGYGGVVGLAEDVRFYGQWMREKAWDQIGHLYPLGPNGDTVIAWLWTRTIKCPNPVCSAQMPLISTLQLSTKKGSRVWLVPHVDKNKKRIKFELRKGKGSIPNPPKVGRGAKFRCLVCGEIAPEEQIKKQGMLKQMGSQLLAFVTVNKTGRNYHAPVDQHESIAKIESTWRPLGEIVDDPRAFTCKLYGFTEIADLFTERQTVALTTFSDLIMEVYKQVLADSVSAGRENDNVPLDKGGSGARAYAEAIVTYLAFAVDKYAMYGNAFVTWYTKENRPSMLFTRQAIPMVWDYTEVNPFSEIGGSFIRSVEIVADSIKSLKSQATGHVRQSSAAEELITSNTVISTDPPYYDNVPYADLSDFFYIWLRRTLRNIYPTLFATLLTPKDEEIVAAPYRHGGNKSAEKHFVTELRKAFTQMRKSMHPDYPMTVYYAFKESELSAISSSKIGQEELMLASTGWETMLEGLLEAGFQITGTWPMRTERAGRVRDTGSNALASSVVLICRPRLENAPITSRREFVNELRRDLPKALQEMQSGNIAPVDLAQASIGPGMAVYSRYSKVLEPNGERLSVRTALQLINYELDAYLAEQEGTMDQDSRFAVAWFEQFGFKEGGFGQADVLARAKNTSVEGLANAGVLQSGAGKVRLYRWQELDPGWDPASDHRLTVWEATHHLIERLNTYGEEGTARLLAKMPGDLAAEARQMAYRLYSICERKGWAEHARDYNALVISWNASQEQAQELKEQYQQGTLFE